MDLPLKDVRVLDLCVGTGEPVSRCLADLGADVVRLEPSTTQRSGDRAEDVFFRATHSANKRSLSLDLDTDADLEAFWALAAGFDIVVESSRPSEHADNPVAPGLLRERLPHLVVVSLTQFGQSGPYRDWQGGDAVHYALSGVLSRSGLPGMQPLLPPGELASESAAIQAAWCALVAYLNRLDTGRGDHVDVSVLECTMQALDPGWGIGGSATGGVPAAHGPRGRPDARHLYPIFPCLDGWVRICVLAPRQWEGMFAWLGRPTEFADPALASLAKRFAAADRIYPAIGRMFAAKTRAMITAEGQRYGVPTAALLSCGEVLSADHFRDRNAFTDAEVEGANVSLVNGMVEVDGHRAGIRTPAPAPGTHNAELRAESAAGADTRRSASHLPDGRAPEVAGRRLPLEGIRVLDLGVIVMGAELGRLLADMGAEVIKVENRAFPDGGRQSVSGDAMTASFAWGHRNKSGLGLSLRAPEGVALFKELAAASDVVLSNFKPGTLESLGLGYDVLSAINPAIVMAESSAFGSTGPWSGRMGYGPLVRAETGVTQRWAYPGEDGSYSDASTIYPDHIAARVGAVAVLALLLRRRRTGRGGTVSVAQAEVILGQIAADLARESVHPGSIRAVGNDLPGDAPRGVFPCAGDDEWLVVDVRTDQQFQALATALHRAELATDPRFATSAAREQHRTEIDRVLRHWTAERAPRDAAEALQRAGVPAAPMNRVRDLLTDPHVVHRGFFRTVSHPHVAEPMPHEGHPGRFQGIGDVPFAPAPLPGEHSRRVLAAVLGLDEGRIEKLVRDGVVEEPSLSASEPVMT
ncbi:crotonobetainyl-CoA:carnitine CoA-transferase CaiB-like acyl-CoA transferase [Marmoricola sp. URHA0025 HA25]